MDDETRAVFRQLLADKQEGLIDTPELKERKAQVFIERDARVLAELASNFPNGNPDGVKEDGDPLGGDSSDGVSVGDGSCSEEEALDGDDADEDPTCIRNAFQSGHFYRPLPI